MSTINQAGGCNNCSAITCRNNHTTAGRATHASGFAAFLLLLFLFALLTPVSSYANPLRTDQGMASWYGTTAHGKVTANGEIFNRYSLTAAHRSLPFGTVLRVHNLVNGRYTLVRVNDRGPYIKGRMLDVSRRAADALNMLNRGVAPIAYEVISDRKGRPLNKDNAYFIHIRNVKDPSKAQAQAERLADKLQRPIKVLATLQGKKSSLALCLGPFKSFSKAQKEFVRCEEEEVALRGIVEAPAKGEDLPLYAAPGRPSPGPVKTASAKLIPRSIAPIPASAAMPSYGSTLQAIWTRSLAQGAHLLDLAMGAISGIQGNQPVFRFHYTLLSGYLDTSS